MHWLAANIGTILAIQFWRSWGWGASAGALISLVFFWMIKRNSSIGVVALSMMVTSMSLYLNVYSNKPVRGEQQVTVAGEVDFPIVRMNDRLRFVLRESNSRKIQVVCNRSCPAIAPFDYVSVVCRLEPIQNYHTPGVFDRQAYYYSKGILGRCSSRHIENRGFDSANPVKLFFRKIDRLKLAIEVREKKRLSQEAAGLLMALLFGAKEAINQELYAIYSRLQIAHIFVVSGSHIAGIWLVVFWLWKWLLVRLFRRSQPNVKNPALCASFFVTALISMIFGIQVSVTRALVCGGILCSALALGRRSISLLVLGMASLALLLLSPLLLFDPSFLLSFLSVLSILTLVKRMPVWIQCGVSTRSVSDGMRKIGRSIETGLNVSFAAACGMLPLIAIQFHFFNFIGIVFNCIAVPVVMLGILPLSAVELLNLPMTNLFLDGLVKWFNTLCQWADTGRIFSAFLVRPNLPEIAVYGLVIGWIAVQESNRLRRLKLLLVMVGFFLYLSVDGHSDRVEAWLLDVGQGDASFLRLPGDVRVLVDSGKRSRVEDMGRDVLLPFLATQRVNRIDVLIISHFDADHYGGALSVLESVNVNEVWFPIVPKKRSVWIDLLVKTIERKKIRVRELWRSCQGSVVLQAGSFSLQCLSPSELYRSSENDRSLVLKLTSPTFSMLLAGDIGPTVQQKLVGRYREQLRSDLLLIPHHGSKNSKCIDFIEEVQPSIAVISAGFRNNYGFPSQEVLEMLRKVPLRIVTGRAGSLKILMGKIEPDVFIYRNELNGSASRFKSFDIP